jgi:oxygen-independent coproporphyrinogen-3 oxidase
MSAAPTGSDAAGVYVHIPFCLTRCGYCDFNAHAGLEHLASRYVRALQTEIDLVAPAWRRESIDSVFFGGGTPTMLAPGELGSVLDRLRERLNVAPGAEVTAEANPDTVTAASLTELRAAGVGRLSIGAQSFDPAVLGALERLHGPAAVRGAVAAAREAGHENLNLDLIYGANGETLASWEQTLEATIALAPEHVSAYALTIEPATALGRKVAAGRVPPPDPDTQAEMFEMACDRLDAAGYHHYEVSNWALPSFECRHNLGYWQRRSNLGLGAGAHSSHGDLRWWNTRGPDAYLAQVERSELPVAGQERLGADEVRLEEVFLRLRTREGVPADWVDEERVAPFLRDGLLRRQSEPVSGAVADGVAPAPPLVATERGMLLLNELVLAMTGDDG